MASLQCHKPCEQTNHTKTCHDHKGYKVETHHNKHTNDHSFTDKVKEMTHKIYHPHDHQNHTHKPTDNNCFTGFTGHHEIKKHNMKMTEGHHEKKHNMKKTEGHDGHCMPKLRDHHTKKKKSHKKREGGCSDSGSSSSSSDESDNESCKKKY